MFKLGDYHEDDAKYIASTLKDAGFKVDMKPSVQATTEIIYHIEGKLSEVRAKAKKIDDYERYIGCIKRVLESRPSPVEFKDRFYDELDPSWKEKDAKVRAIVEGTSALSDEERKAGKDDLMCLVERANAIEFANDLLDLNDIEIGAEVGNKLDDPVIRFNVNINDYGEEDWKAITEVFYVYIEKFYEVYADEFSTPLYRDIDEEFRQEFSDEFLNIMGLGLLIEDLVEDPLEGKVDMKTFSDRCCLELERRDSNVMIIDGRSAAEEIGRVLEKNGVIKIKGNTVKWRK